MKEHTRKQFQARTIFHLLGVIILSISLAGLPMQPAQAGPLVVRVKPAGFADAECGTWAHPCTLQYALTNAVSGAQIWVMHGVYTPGNERSDTFLLKNGVSVMGGYEGEGITPDDRDWVAYPTTLSGEIGTMSRTDNSYHVVKAVGADSSTVLEGFTIHYGYADNGFVDDNGGGMLSLNGSPTLTDIAFNSNHADMWGGGLFMTTSSSVLSNVSFTLNTAGAGGGMGTSDGGPFLFGARFTNNDAVSTGGGMWNNNSDPALTEVTFDGNTAGTGGGGMNNVWGSNPTLTDVTFINNSTTSGDGGGMYNNQGIPALNNVTFKGNSADNGGGMANFGTSNPVVKNVTFFGNSSAGRGGAVWQDSGSTTITNSILWGNPAVTDGSQIYSSGGTLTVTYSDIQGGYSGEGNINSNPILGSLGTYGGNVQVLPLLPGSPVINTGQNSSCTPGDARGFLRPLRGVCDMGAYESHGVDLAAVSGGNESTMIMTAFASPIVVSVTAYDEEPVNGGKVYFNLPTSGASAIPAEPAATIAGGQASMTFTANGVIGSYYIVYYTFGSDDLVGAHYMTNLPNPFLSLIYLPLVLR